MSLYIYIYMGMCTDVQVVHYGDPVVLEDQDGRSFNNLSTGWLTRGYLSSKRTGSAGFLFLFSFFIIYIIIILIMFSK